MVGNAPVRAVAGDAGGSHLGTWPYPARGGGILDRATLYAGVETARRPIAKGADPGLFEEEVRVAALGQHGGRLSETGDHGVVVRNAR